MVRRIFTTFLPVILGNFTTRSWFSAYSCLGT